MERATWALGWLTDILASLSGLAFGLLMLIFWWRAYLAGDWKVHLAFNFYNEAWLEGILFHSAVFLTVIGTIRTLRK